MICQDWRIPRVVSTLLEEKGIEKRGKTTVRRGQGRGQSLGWKETKEEARREEGKQEGKEGSWQTIPGIRH